MAPSASVPGQLLTVLQIAVQASLPHPKHGLSPIVPGAALLGSPLLEVLICSLPCAERQSLRLRPPATCPSDRYVTGPSCTQVSGLKAPDPTRSFKSRVMNSVTLVPCACLSVPL